MDINGTIILCNYFFRNDEWCKLSI